MLIKGLIIVVSQDKHLNQTEYFVLTANRLLDGRVVWLTPQNYWSIMIEEALLFSKKEEAEEKSQYITQTKDIHFLIDLHCTEIKNSLLPTTTREQIRASGPSTHPEFNLRSLQDHHQ